MTSDQVFLEQPSISGYEEVSLENLTVPSLPLELLGCVMQHIQCRNTLAALATSAAILQDEAERHLYRIILIQSPADLQSLFSALLTGNRNLSRCNSVRSLEFKLLEDECQDQDLDNFQKLLSTTPNLTNLRFWTRPRRTGLPFHHPITMANYAFQLRTLGIGESSLHSDQLVQFLESQPSIQVLELYPTSSIPDNPIDFSALPNEALPNLTKIAARIFNVLQLVPGRPVTAVILRDWLEMARVVDVAKVFALSTVPVSFLKCLTSVVAPQFFVTIGSYIPGLEDLDLEVAFSLRGYELASIASQMPSMPSLKTLTISGFRTARFVSLAPSPADDAILFAERFALSFSSLTKFTLVSKTEIGKTADCATCILCNGEGWSVAEEFSVGNGDRSSKWMTCVAAISKRRFDPPIFHTLTITHQLIMSSDLSEGAKGADAGSLPEKNPIPYDSGMYKGSDSEIARGERGVDVVVGLIAGHGEESDLDLQAAYRLRHKLDLNMVPLLCVLYTLQFIDKNSLGSSSILGIIPDNHLTTNQFNNLSTAFYIGYIIFVGPHAWLMQRFPIAKYIALNIGLWGIFLGLQAACHNYGGLFALRVLLGASESCITSGLMTIMTMFYTRLESTQRISWVFMCNGVAIIISAFISFGVAHTKSTSHPRQWQWYMMLISILSVIVSVLYFWRMPDNPATARFLDEQEKVNVVKRIRVNQNGIEAKVWKRYQFIEAITDIKTWLFFLFGAVANLQSGTGVEYGIIIKGYGFNTLQTTLLSIPLGGAVVISVTIGTILLKYFPNSRCIVGIIGWILCSISCLLLMFLPSENTSGLLVAFYFLGANVLGFIMILSLVAVVFSGHTKKMTCNAIFLVGYSIGQMLCTQFWKEKYRPRNTVPWIIELCTYVFDIFMILVIRWYLVRENRKRDAEKLASGGEYDEFGYVEHTQEDGSIIRLKVPIQFMDITDKENRAFRYPL